MNTPAPFDWKFGNLPTPPPRGPNHPTAAEYAVAMREDDSPSTGWIYPASELGETARP